MYTITIIKYN